MQDRLDPPGIGTTGGGFFQLRRQPGDIDCRIGWTLQGLAPLGEFSSSSGDIKQDWPKKNTDAGQNIHVAVPELFTLTTTGASPLCGSPYVMVIRIIFFLLTSSTSGWRIILSELDVLFTHSHSLLPSNIIRHIFLELWKSRISWHVLIGQPG